MDENEFRGFVKAKLEEIHVQTMRTNGSVADLYKKHEATNVRVNDLCNWRWFITGGLVVVSALIVPVLIYIIQGWVK
jgi:hypothetical protein